MAVSCGRSRFALRPFSATLPILRKPRRQNPSTRQAPHRYRRAAFFISALGRGANQDLKAGVITQAEQDKADREAVAQEVPTKTKGEIIVEEAMGKPLQKEGQSHENPTVAKTEKSPPSERGSETKGSTTDRGTAKQADSRPEMDRQGYHNRK